MPLDKEKAKKNLKEILERMQDDTDIAKVHEYYQLFKKEISFFKRSWAAAWLFMYYDSKEMPSARNDVKSVCGKTKKTQRIEKTEKKSTEVSAASVDHGKSEHGKSAADSDNRIILSDEESKRLFFSIGKNRRLFPKEIISLILSKTSAAREDIGIIRILDNYSFVQVKDIKADEIIATLTGHRFRGRTLMVNYAKPKTESESESDSD